MPVRENAAVVAIDDVVDDFGADFSEDVGLGGVRGENIVEGEGFGAAADVIGFVDDEVGLVGGSDPDGDFDGCFRVHRDKYIIFELGENNDGKYK